MASRKKISPTLSSAFIGWVASAIFTLVIGLTWPIIFPAIIRPEHYYGDGPSLFQIIATVLLATAPLGLIGGIVGSRVSIEGGDNSQRLLAIIFGIILSTPCACYGLWFFTGF